MRIVDPKEIHTVTFFLEEELSKLRSKRKPIDINIDQMNALLELDLKNMSIEDILTDYGSSEDGE